jgi:XTP/dITP diphosphohydrolase
MRQLILATNNPHKIAEITAILASIPIKILSASDFADFPKVEETGQTLEDNAGSKVKMIWDTYHIPSLADDTGLEVDYLNGAPGIFSARFAGPGCSYNDNKKKLLSLMEGIPESQRKARFRTAIAFIDKDGTLHSVDGVLDGSIATRPRGKFGFGYDPIFVVFGTDRTLSQFPPKEKNGISHRSRALAKIQPIIIEALS